jgi:uncharacterized membrane protein YfcA
MQSLTWLDAHGALYSICGFAVGMLVGMTGVGGGSLMTPLLILLFGIHPATAVGTDLLYAAVTKTAGTAVHGFRRTINWRITSRLATGSVPATLLTVFFLHRSATHGVSYNHMLAPVLAFTLVMTAVSILFRQKILNFVGKRFGEPRPSTVTLLTVISGAVLGILVSLTSVGAGAIGMVALVVLYPREPTVRIVGSDIAHAVPLTLLAGVGHWYLGAIDWSLLGSLLMGSLPGILLGSYLATRVRGGVLRPILAVALVLAARQLVY